jgi:hypothetical protein
MDEEEAEKDKRTARQKKIEIIIGKVILLQVMNKTNKFGLPF